MVIVANFEEIFRADRSDDNIVELLQRLNALLRHSTKQGTFREWLTAGPNVNRRCRVH